MYVVASRLQNLSFQPFSFSVLVMVTLQNGQPLPPLVFGTGFRESGRRGHVDAALVIGYRAIDSASSRKFHDEELDGDQLLKGLQSTGMAMSIRDVFVQSKFTPAEWHIEPRPFGLNDNITTQVMKSVLRSARDLQVATLDAYLLHGPLDTIEETTTAWKTLEDIVLHGGIRYLGICNVDLSTLEQLYSAAIVKPTLVQNRLRERGNYDRGVVEFCAANGIVYQVFGVLWKSNQGLLQSETVRNHASANGYSAVQALYNLLIATAREKGVQLSIVDGASCQQNMADNLIAAEVVHVVSKEVLSDTLRLLQWKD